MSKQERKRYTKEYKDDAVDMILAQGHVAKQVATNLGINYKMLCGWKAKRVQDGGHAFPNPSSSPNSLNPLFTNDFD
ncbi:MAG: transposase [Mariprofundaceae bacterium]|nr:transposase [Mariprofundaceae bacterium]